MRVTRHPAALYLGLTVALLVNLGLIALYFWSQGGQTTLVELRNDGGAFRALTDGKQVVPGGNDERSAAVLDVPERGTIILVVAPPSPSLPGPSGVDSIVVTGADGEVLFRDDFEALDPNTWQVLAGDFEVIDGVLTAKSTDSENSLLLRTEGWSDYDVAVTYRNSPAGVIGVNVTGEGRLFYHFDLLRDFPSYFNVSNNGAEQPGAAGSLMRTDYAGPLKSAGNMLARVYPYLLAALAVGTLLVLVLSAAEPIAERVSALTERHSSHRSPSPPAGRGSGGGVALLIAAAMALVAIGLTAYLNLTYYGAIPHLPDEVSYLFQADLFSHLKVTGDIPPVRQAFYFYNPSSLYEHGDQWASFYPFGHPLVLTIGVLLGIVDYIPSLVGAACVLLTFLIGRRLFDARTGLIAAGLLLASPFFLMQASSYMSHNTAMLYVLLAFYCILRRNPPLLWGALGGLFFGLAFNTRTLTAVALAPVFGAYMLSYVLNQREVGREWVRHTAPFLAAGLVMIGAMLLYNYAITGDALTSPYTGTQGASSELFGFRDGHHLDIGLRNLQAQLMALLVVFNAWPQWAALGLVLLPFVLGTRDLRDYFLAACVLAPIAIYIGYRYSGIYEGPRYWYETMPFLVLLSARGASIASERMTFAAAWVRDRLPFGPQPSYWAGSTVVYAAVAVLVVYGTGGWLFGWTHEREAPLVPAQASSMEGLFGVDGRLDALANEMDLHDALVLVKPCGPFNSPACYGSVFLRNLPNFDGDVVWALYDESRNAETISAYPNRVVYVATWAPVSIEPLSNQ